MQGRLRGTRMHGLRGHPGAPLSVAIMPLL